MGVASGLSMEGDTVQIVLLASLFGAIGGIAALLTREPTTGQTSDIRNRLPFPRIMRFKSSSRWSSIDAGMFGPILLGAVAAVLIVFTVGAEPISADQAAAKLSDTSDPSAVASALLVKQISYARLIVLALGAGIGATVIIRGIAASPSKIVGQVAGAASEMAGTKAAEAAKAAGIEERDVAKIRSAAIRGATDGAYSAAGKDLEQGKEDDPNADD
ncbi:hypothetical protein BH10ACT11_BH10ACT11_14300 [soil metagenome]